MKKSFAIVRRPRRECARDARSVQQARIGFLRSVLAFVISGIRAQKKVPGKERIAEWDPPCCLAAWDHINSEVKRWSVNRRSETVSNGGRPDSPARSIVRCTL
jgi:hypothetical protein